MRLTSSIRLLLIAGLLAFPAAASASPPAPAPVVEPLAVKATVVRELVPIALVLVNRYEAAAIVIRDSAVQAGSHASPARSGVQGSAAVHTAIAVRALQSHRLRPCPLDSASLANLTPRTIGSNPFSESPNVRMPSIATHGSRDTSATSDARASSQRQRR